MTILDDIIREARGGPVLDVSPLRRTLRQRERAYGRLDRARSMRATDPWSAATQILTSYMAHRDIRDLDGKAESARRDLREQIQQDREADQGAFADVFRTLRHGHRRAVDPASEGGIGTMEYEQVYKPGTKQALAAGILANPRLMNNDRKLRQALTLGRMLTQADKKGLSAANKSHNMRVLEAREAVVNEGIGPAGMLDLDMSGTAAEKQRTLRMAAQPLRGVDDPEYRRFAQFSRSGDPSILDRQPEVGKTRTTAIPADTRRVGQVEKHQESTLDRMAQSIRETVEVEAEKEARAPVVAKVVEMAKQGLDAGVEAVLPDLDADEQEAIAAAREQFAERMRRRIRREPRTPRGSETGVPKALLKSGVDLAMGAIDAGRAGVQGARRLRAEQAEMIEGRRAMRQAGAEAAMRRREEPRPGPRGSEYEFDAPVEAVAGPRGSEYRFATPPRPGPRGSESAFATPARPGPRGSEAAFATPPRPGPRGSEYEFETPARPGPRGSEYEYATPPRPGPRGSESAFATPARPGPRGSEAAFATPPRPGPRGSEYDFEDPFGGVPVPQDIQAQGPEAIADYIAAYRGFDPNEAARQLMAGVPEEVQARGSEAVAAYLADQRQEQRRERQRQGMRVELPEAEARRRYPALFENLRTGAEREPVRGTIEYGPEGARVRQAAQDIGGWLEKRRGSERRKLAPVRVRGNRKPIMQWTEADIETAVRAGVFSGMTAQQKRALKMRIEELRGGMQ